MWIAVVVDISFYLYFLGYTVEKAETWKNDQALSLCTDLLRKGHVISVIRIEFGPSWFDSLNK